MRDAGFANTLRYVVTQECGYDEEPRFTFEMPGRHPCLVGRALGGAAQIRADAGRPLPGSRARSEGRHALERQSAGYCGGERDSQGRWRSRTTRQASFAIPETARDSAVASQCSPVINTMSLPLGSRICGLARAGFDTDAPDRLRNSLLWARSRRPVRLARTRAIGAGGARRLGSGCRSTG